MTELKMVKGLKYNERMEKLKDGIIGKEKHQWKDGRMKGKWDR